MLKFAGIQLKVCVDKDTNLRRAGEKIAEAASKGAKLISLPECFNSPYGAQFFADYAEPIPEGPTTVFLKEQAIKHGIYLIGGSHPERDGDKLYNTCVIFGPDGEAIAKHRKVHLADVNIPGGILLQESSALTPGDTFTLFDC